MDDLEYEVLAWLGAGNKVFRPREATVQAEEAFRSVIAVLERLRERGLLTYLDAHVGRTESGIYLMVLERNPDAMKPEPLPGYVWLETPGKCCTSPRRTWSSAAQSPAVR